MAKKTKTSGTPKLPKSLRKGALPKPVSDVLAAGLGALEKAQDAGAESFDSLVALGSGVVDRGGDAAKAAAAQVEKAAAAIAGTARGVVGGAAETVGGGVEAVVETALEKLGVPGREEVLALRAQVDALQARLAELTAAPAAASAYEVRPHERGWAVARVGAERASAVHGTKKEAVRDARQTAKAHAPSVLTVYKTDGDVSETIEYEAG